MEAKSTAYHAAIFFIVVSLVSSFALLLGDNISLIQTISAGQNIDQVLAKTLMKSLVPIVYIAPIAYINIAYLNAQKRFIAAAVAPVLYNAFILISVVLCILFHIQKQTGILFISAAISAAAFLMFLYLLLVSSGIHNKIVIKKSLAESGRNIGKMKKLGNQTVLLIGIFFLYQSVLFFERYFTNQVSPGGISALNYSYRLAQFPVWVFISALLVILLPELSRQAAVENYQELYSRLHHAGMILLLFITPIAVLMCLLRTEVLSVMMLRGEFGQNSLEMTSQIMAGYSLSIVFQSISYLLLRVYLVFGKMKSVFYIYIVSSIVNILFDFAVYRVLGLWAIGIGAIVGWVTNMLLLLILSEAEMKRKVFYKNPKILVIIAGANLAAIVSVILVKKLFETLAPFSVGIFQTMIPGIVCALTYFAIYTIILAKTKILYQVIHN